MAQLKLYLENSLLTCDSTAQSLNLCILVVETSSNEEPLYRYQIQEGFDWSSSDSEMIEGIELVGNSFSATITENGSSSDFDSVDGSGVTSVPAARTSTVEITANLQYFDENLNTWVDDGQSTISFQIQQDPSLAAIEIPPAPEAPAQEDSIFKKAYEANKEDIRKLREKIESIINKVWLDLLQLAKEFIDEWRNKIYDILCGVANQINQEIAIRKSKVYNYANNCIKISKYNDKVGTEMRRSNEFRDQTMIDNWNEKVQNLIEDCDNIINDLKEDHTLTNAGCSIMKTWQKESQSQIVQHMTDGALTSFCDQYFADNEQSLLDKLRNTFNLSNLGAMIESKFNELINDGRVLFNGVVEMVNSAITSVTEPMGAVIATSTGPGTCVTNPLQIRGVIKRVQSQAVALVPVINAMLDAAIFLGLPASLCQTLVGIATTLTIVGTIKV